MNPKYPLEMFSNQKKASQFLCYLCKGVFINPVICQCESDITYYCYECLEKYLEQSNEKLCPKTS